MWLWCYWPHVGQLGLPLCGLRLVSPTACKLLPRGARHQLQSLPRDPPHQLQPLPWGHPHELQSLLRGHPHQQQPPSADAEGMLQAVELSAWEARAGSYPEAMKKLVLHLTRSWLDLSHGLEPPQVCQSNVN